MCGIAGEVRFGNPPDAAAVARATRALAHRGPDAESFFTEGPAALGHRRLAILDIAGGVQPMTQDGVTLVFNGQVFEHDALREELRKKGHTFKTRSDTEVVLRAYLEWGELFAGHLDGMLACALWDSRSQRLVFSRDRMGKKPLHYALSEGRIVFGSELKALLAHGAITRAIDPEALVQYLSSEAIAAPRTLFKDVKKLPPGCTAVFDAKGLRVFQYWELPAPDYHSFAYQRSRPSTLGLDASDAHLPSGDVHEAAQELLKLLDGAVARRLVADVPVGVFLSGGVDSTTIAALSARHKQPLDTFSIGFQEASFDETPFALMAAEKIGSRHQTLRLSGQNCLDLLPDAVDTLDEPMADPSILPTLLLSRFTRKHVTVALAGDGGDELFAGYDPFLAHRPAALLARLPNAALSLFEKAASLLPSSSKNMSFDFRVKQFLRGAKGNPSLRHAQWLAAFLPGESASILSDPYKPFASEAIAFGPVLADAARAQALGVLPGSIDEALRFYQQRYLADDILVKADRASMAASLELRAPFLDKRVVEFAARLPPHTKLSLSRTKVVLKRAALGLIPEEILGRAKKGFGIPVAAWIRGPLRPLFEDLFSENNLKLSGLFDPAKVQALLATHLAGRADLRKPLWTLAMLLLWQRRWGGQPGAA
jgi:asparagine synthase (glutamine-hydrolysing)